MSMSYDDNHYTTGTCLLAGKVWTPLSFQLWIKVGLYTVTIMIIIMISIELNICNTQTSKIQAVTDRLCCSVTNAFISFWLRFFDARRERHNSQKSFVSYYANTTPTFGTSRGILDLNSSSLVRTRRNGRKLNSMAENSILCPNGRGSIVCLHGPISNP